MNKINNINKSIILSLLVISQLYFSAFTPSEFENTEKKFLNSETYFISSYTAFSNDANINSKVSIYEKVLSAQKLFNDNFYSIVLSIAEDLGLLFFINSEKNPNYLLLVITEETVPRSPPLS